MESPGVPCKRWELKSRNVSKKFGTFEALKNMKLSVAGRRASGASWPVRAPARQRCFGSLRGWISRTQVQSSEWRRRVREQCEERRVGFVFQHYALFRHMTVFENVAFGLRVRPQASCGLHSAKICRTCHLPSETCPTGLLADRYPGQLSGDNASGLPWRALLPSNPKFCFSMNPLALSTRACAKELRMWLRRLHDEINVACVFVTHDQEEALEVSDRVAIMDKGRIEQIGTPEDVYENPANPFVYSFLGNVNLFHGRVHSGKARIGDIEVDAPDHHDAADSPAVVYARPHEMDVSRESAEPTRLRVTGPGFSPSARTLN